MGSVDKKQLETLFHEAMDGDPAARDRMVADLEAQDPEMAEALKSCLARFQKMDRFFEQAPKQLSSIMARAGTHGGKRVSFQDMPTPDDRRRMGGPDDVTVGDHARLLKHRPTDVIGDYQLIREIGKGGMGVVYLARNQTTDQKVALKVISDTRMDDNFQRRFNLEYHVLARMSHTHIARIYGADQVEGQSYFAMEYVDGQPINYFCNALKLDMKQRLELMLQVCEGVFHAHQKAVVHRDLKPSNILVAMEGEKPVVKVIDFGIAKDLASALNQEPSQTRHGDIIGTPDHMSPEQLTGKAPIDTRSDIYSLGVVLYELLTGELPIDRDTLRNKPLGAVIRFYESAQAPTPSTRIKRLKEEGKISDERRRLIQDFDRELDWIIMKAMEKDIEDRYATVADLATDIRNYLENRPISASAPGWGYLLRKFVKRNKIWVSSAAVAFTAVVLGVVAAVWGFVETQKARKNAEAALVRMENANDFLMDMIAAPDPRDAGTEVKIMEILDREELFLNKNQRGDLLEASVRRRLGRTYFGLGVYSKATTHLTRSMELHRSLLGETDAHVARDAFFLAGTALRQPRLQQARQYLDTALAIQSKRLPNNHRHRLQTLTLVATYLIKQRDYTEAEHLFKDVLDRQLSTLGDRDADTMKTMVGLANSLFYQADYANAEKHYRSALKAQREMRGDGHPETMATIHNLAVCCDRLGRTDEAEIFYWESTQLRRQFLPEGHNLTFGSMQNLVGFYLRERRPYDAEPLIYQMLNETSAPETSQRSHRYALFLLARFYEVTRQPGEALLAYQACLAKPEPPGEAMQNLWRTGKLNQAALLSQLGRHHEALTALTELSARVPEHQGNRLSHYIRGKAYTELGFKSQAYHHLCRSHEFALQFEPERLPKIINALIQLGEKETADDLLCGADP